MSPPHASVSRDTRLLFAIVLISIATIWVLARVRFPERAPSPNLVPPVLAQLRPPSAFDDMTAAVAQLELRVAPLIVPIEIDDPGSASPRRRRRVSVFRIRGDLGVVLLDGSVGALASTVIGVDEIARDRASQLAVIRVAGAPPPPVTTWSPRTLHSPRFLIAVDPTSDGASLRPVYVGSLHATVSPIWSGVVWELPATTDLSAGTIVFTIDGALAGLAIDHHGQPALVPGDTVLDLVTRLEHDGKTRPGDLGITVQPLTPEIVGATGAGAGVIVAWVDPRGPSAGRLAVTDVIEAANRHPITTVEDWRALVARLADGDEVALSVRSRGSVVDVRVTAAGAAAPVAARSSGLRLRTMPGIGSVVTGLAPDSAAALVGLQAGDVITVVGGLTAPTAVQVSRALLAARPRPVTIAFTRGEAHHVVALRRTW